MTAVLSIAVPSKGRLQENTFAFFARAGLKLSQEGGSRDYRGTIRDMPGVEILFLSASEIVAKLAAGDVHFGVTGEDLIREAVPAADSLLILLAPPWDLDRRTLSSLFRRAGSTPARWKIWKRLQPTSIHDMANACGSPPNTST